MKCEEFMSLLPMYPDALSPDRDAGIPDRGVEAFLRHASECTACGDRLREHKTMMSMLRVLDEGIEAPDTLSAQWRDAIAQEKKYKSNHHPWQNRMIAIVASLFLLTGTVLMREGIIFKGHFEKATQQMEADYYTDTPDAFSVVLYEDKVDGVGAQDSDGVMQANEAALQTNESDIQASKPDTQNDIADMQPIPMTMMPVDMPEALFMEEELPNMKSFAFDAEDTVEVAEVTDMMDATGTFGTMDATESTDAADTFETDAEGEQVQTSLPVQISNIITESTDAVYVFLKDMLAFLVIMLPYLVCIGSIVCICYAVRCIKINKIKKEGNEQK